MQTDSQLPGAPPGSLDPVVMRQISRLRFTIEPWYLGNGMRELRVEAIVNGTEHTVVTLFEVDDFESHFDWLMERSKREIMRLVKAHNATGQARRENPKA